MPLSSTIAVVIYLWMLFVSSAMAGYPHTGLPVDGRSGFLWKSNISFPVYPSYIHPYGGSANITWAELDGIFLENEQINATAGICFGLCLFAFLNVVALTPKPKRGLPLYTFILIALALLTARYLTLMVLYTDLEVGSAYYNIAADYADGETIRSIIAIVFVIWLPPFAFLFLILCLYVQGKCVLVLIALKHRHIYKTIMSYLLTLSISTIGLRMVYAAFVTVNQFNSNFFLPQWMNTAALATYTATILSWSLIFSWQVGMVIFNRYKLGGPIEKGEGLAILFMTGIESMLIPVIFTILQLTHIPWFPNAEYLIMPSIACIIPFGSIWAGAANQHASLQRAIHTNMAAAPIVCTNCSLMTSTATNGHSHDSSTAGNNAASAAASSPTPLNPRISVFPTQATQNENGRNDSTLSSATIPSPNSRTNPTTRMNIFASMPMTRSILGMDRVSALNDDDDDDDDQDHINRSANRDEEVLMKRKYNADVKDIST